MAILRVKADLLHYHVPDVSIASIAAECRNQHSRVRGAVSIVSWPISTSAQTFTMEVARVPCHALGNENRNRISTAGRSRKQLPSYIIFSLEAMCGGNSATSISSCHGQIAMT